MPLFEVWDGCRVEECKTVDFGQDVSDVFILTVNGSNPIHSEKSPGYIIGMDKPV